MSLVRKFKKQDRKKVVHNFRTAKNTAIVFDITDAETFRHIRDFSKFLDQMGIRALLLGYVNSDEIPNGLVLWENCQVMSKKNLDYFFRPTETAVLNMIGKDYDILFDLCMNDHLPLTYFTCLSKAKFKVGRYKETLNDSDLMIDISREPTVDFLITQIKNYVSILNNPEKAGTVPIK